MDSDTYKIASVSLIFKDVDESQQGKSAVYLSLDPPPPADFDYLTCTQPCLLAVLSALDLLVSSGVGKPVTTSELTDLDDAFSNIHAVRTLQ